MDNRDVFEVQADFTLDVFKHNLRMIAATVGQPRFPRFVRKMRAQLEHFLVLIETFEKKVLEDSEKESEEELAKSAEFLKINCYVDDDESEESSEWSRMEWEEHQLLLTELNEEEEEFFTTTKFRCKVLRIKVRLLINRLNTLAVPAISPLP